MTVCTCAGRGGAHDVARLGFTFARPDAARVDPGGALLLRTDRAGDFVRAVLPVRLTGDMAVMFDIWLSVAPEDLERVADAPNHPDEPLTVYGTLANAIQPWGDALLGAGVWAELHDGGPVPHVTATEDSTVARMLADEWDRDDVLGCFAEPLTVPIRARINADWTIARDAGFAVRTVAGSPRLLAPGRTVVLETGGVPAGRSRDDELAYLLTSAPTPIGEAREDTAGEVRYAFWIAARRYELYGFVVRDDTFLQVTAVYEDPRDHEWAVRTWRSARYQPL